MSISKCEDLELDLNRQPNACFINNCFNVGLKAWLANTDIQSIFNEYKAVTYLRQYFSKTEDQHSQAMKQAAKEDFENKMHHHDTIKTIARAYLSNRDCFFYHILPKLKLKRIFPVVHFIKNNLPAEKVQVLVPQRELSKLPDEAIIFNRSLL